MTMVDATQIPLAQETEESLLTLDEYLALQAESELWFEIIDGELKGKNMPGGGGLTHGGVAVNVSTPIRLYLRKHPEHGIVFADAVAFLMFNVGKRLKNSFIPDVGFLRADNIPKGWSPDKPHPGVPNLAIEITSPNDSSDEITQKVKTYLEKGTEQVWILSPRTKTVDQHYRDADGNKVSRQYSGDQVIDTSALFPDIDPLTPDEIFDLPDWLPVKK